MSSGSIRRDSAAYFRAEGQGDIGSPYTPYSRLEYGTPIPGTLSTDAWGRAKSINDYSMFRGMFTYDVPNQKWEEFSVNAALEYTPLSQTGTNATSVDGALQIVSGTTTNSGTTLLSKRHPRYQPNRGHLWSTAGWLPSPEADGHRIFGLMCGCLAEDRRSGVYFELEGDGSTWQLFAVLRSYGVVKHRTNITAFIPDGVDISKNNLYDIQYQWRGAGNYFFYINQQLVHTIEHLNTAQDLSLWNPALSAGFQCFTDSTTELVMHFGCVAITSEGGSGIDDQFVSLSTGENLVTVTNTSTAVLAIKMPRTIQYNGSTVVNTRDVIASKIGAWTKDEAAVQVWFARDTVVPNLDALTWNGGNATTIHSLVGGKGGVLDVAFQADKANMQLVVNEWHDHERKNVIENPGAAHSPFWVTAGDILVVAVRSAGTNKDHSTTLYLSEEV